MNNSITPLLFCIVVSLFSGSVGSAQTAGSLSDRELRTLKNEIWAKSRIMEQLRDNGEPVPTNMRSDMLSYLVPYSPTLSENEEQLAFAVLGVVAGLCDDHPLESGEVDTVIGWMIAKGWGESAIVRSSRDANLNSAQFARLIDGLFSREEPLDYARTRTIERLVDEGELASADLDSLGERLLGTRNDVHFRLLMKWLLRANKAGKIKGNSVAAQALLRNADQVKWARAHLAPLLHSNNEPEILGRLAELAVAKNSYEVTELLMTLELPDEILLSLEPMAAIHNRSFRFKVANTIVQRFGTEADGTDWLVAKSQEEAAPEALRILSIKQLAKIEPTHEIREALMKQYSRNVSPLHVEALRALRKYELPKQLLEDATANADVDIQREAWQQMNLRYGISTPIKTKWRIYPNSRNEDIGEAIGLAAAASAIIMALTALIAPVIVGALWKSLALFVVGGVASFVSWGFFAVLIVSSQHGNAFADGDIQKMLGIVIAVLWTLIGISWFAAIRAHRGRRADAEALGISGGHSAF